MVNNELSHHGILGMKWGVRRTPEQLGHRKKTTNNQKNDANESERKMKLTDKQKTAIKVGAAFVGTALVVYGGYKLAKSGKLDKFAEKGKTFIDGKYGGVSELNLAFTKSKVPHDVTKDYLGINPNLTSKISDVNHMMMAPDGRPLSTVNCQACTLGYEMKCRGYNTIAQLVDTRQYSSEYLMNKLYKNPQIKNTAVKAWSDLDKELVKQGNGARGNLLLNLANGGHSVAYEVVNGKLVLLDTQHGKAFGSNVLDAVYGASKDAVSYVRTDNLEFNDIDFIKRLVVSKPS